MPWPVPLAKEIAARAAVTLETRLQKIRPLVDPLAISRSVRSKSGVLSHIIRAISLELRSVHDHQSWWAAQYFPDTAEDEFTLRHANIWGVPRRPATKAVGTLVIEGTAGTIIPALTEFAVSDGVIFTNNNVETIGVGGSVSVAATAVKAGTAGNIEGDVQLAAVLPFPDVSKVTIDPAGMIGGADIESYESLKAATLAYIRQRPYGGAGFDYPFWIGREFDSEAVRTLPGWIGRGSVGVAVVMRVKNAFGRAPTQNELDAMLAYLGPLNTPAGVRPVTANVVMVAGIITPIDVTIRLRPDTPETRGAVTEAYSRFLATLGDDEDTSNDSPIGATIEPSRLSEAISAAAGEYAHDLILPAIPHTLGDADYPVPGVITWEAPL